MSTEARTFALGTSLVQSFPWGLYWGGSALCADGTVRKLARIAQTADTFFSVPAAVRIMGTTVAGYVSVEALSGSSVATEDDPAVVRFHTYRYGKNGDLIDDPAVAFFYRHAGYSHTVHETKNAGRLRTARQLARAERWATEAGLETLWEDDWSCGSHMHEYGEPAYTSEPQSCESAALVDVNYVTGHETQTRVYAALSCVDDASESYRRVVAAELAYEAQSDVARVVAGLLMGHSS